MKNIRCVTKFMIMTLSITLSIALLAVPALAAQPEAVDFHALSNVPADDQTLASLTDEQLASVEGGNHITTAYLLLQTALNLAGNNPGLFGQQGQLGNILSSFGLVIGLSQPWPPICFGFGSC
jgi:hypothetical protein